jgi:hypothetical protein
VHAGVKLNALPAQRARADVAHAPAYQDGVILDRKRQPGRPTVPKRFHSG